MTQTKYKGDNMDVIRLRTLTEKSTLGFGKFADMSVGQVIALNKTTYLRWCYYNLSGISFSDDVLKKIYLPDSFKIEKPGINPTLGQKLSDDNFKSLHLFKKLHVKKKTRCVAKNRMRLVTSTFNIKHSQLTSKNRGHDQSGKIIL